MPQLDVFWVIHSLRQLNFPIKSLENYLEEPSPNSLIELSKNQLKKVDEEIDKLKRIRCLLNNIIKQSEEALSASIGEIIFKNLEKEYVIFSDKTALEGDTSTEEWSNYYDEFLSKINFKRPSYIGSIIDKNDLTSGRFGRIDRLFVKTDKKSNMIKPSGLYAVTYYKGNYELIVDFYKEFMKKLKEQGFTVYGDAYEEYLLNVLSTQNTSDFVTKISVEVKKGKF